MFLKIFGSIQLIVIDGLAAVADIGLACQMERDVVNRVGLAHARTGMDQGSRDAGLM